MQEAHEPPNLEKHMNLSDAAPGSRVFFHGAGSLVGELVQKMRLDSPGMYRAVSTELLHGGFLRLQVAFGMAGVVDCSLWLVGPRGGEPVELFTLEQQEGPPDGGA